MLLLAGCREEDAETPSRIAQSFESAEAVLYDFDIDGALTATGSDEATVRRRIETQLLYAVGQLNGERSVGRHAAVDISAITIASTSTAGRFDVRYRARLPVAWGAAAPPPARYELVLPTRVEATDQAAFATKYGASCTDPKGGIQSAADAGRVFLFFRPFRPGCLLDANDVVRVGVTTALHAENTTGKYPEYDRIWSDGALEAVAVFGEELSADPSDAGVAAYDRFVLAAAFELSVLQPDASQRIDRRDGRRVELGATLRDGRRVHLRIALVGKDLAKEGAAFDAWYDGATPRADLVVYSGHAGLGANVSALAQKGRFDAGQYRVLFVNGCDTLAYVDEPASPDVDVVANALGSWFSAGDAATLAFVKAFVGAPQTYRAILAQVDPEQVAVVFGEEDNTYAPPPAAEESPSSAPRVESLLLSPSAPVLPAATSDGSGGCSSSGRSPAGAPLLALLVLFTVSLFRRVFQ